MICRCTWTNWLSQAIWKDFCCPVYEPRGLIIFCCCSMMVLSSRGMCTYRTYVRSPFAHLASDFSSNDLFNEVFTKICTFIYKYNMVQLQTSIWV